MLTRALHFKSLYIHANDQAEGSDLERWELAQKAKTTFDQVLFLRPKHRTTVSARDELIEEMIKQGIDQRKLHVALTLRLLFKLPLKQTEGFLTSIFRLMNLGLNVPDHTTLS